MHHNMEYATDLDLWSPMSDFLFTPSPSSLDTLGHNDFGALDAFEDPFTTHSDLSGYCDTPSSPSTTEEEICGSPSGGFTPPEPHITSAPAWQPPVPLYYQYQYQVAHQPPTQPQQMYQQMQSPHLQFQQYQYLSPPQEVMAKCYGAYPAPVQVNMPPPAPKLEFPTDVLPLEALPFPLSPPLPVTHVKSPLDSYSYNCCKSYDEPMGSMQQLGFSSHVQFTNLDASHFGTQLDPVKKLRSIPMDISGNLTDAQYYKIFKLYHLQLQLDSHPIMTEEDLEDIKLHGRMYFLKNVKTIVPKIGFWKFHAHLSHRRSDERQYNIPGMAVTCKVREWVTDDGLWRLYHFKKGKTVKSKRLYDI